MFHRLPTVLGGDRQPNADTVFFFAVADKFVDSINQFGNQHLEAVFKIYLAAEILVSFTVLDTNSGTQVVILVF